jgi:hypothetical protein
LEFVHDVVKVLTTEHVVGSSAIKVQNPMPLRKTFEKQNVQVVLPQVVVGSPNHLQEAISTQWQW